MGLSNLDFNKESRLLNERDFSYLRENSSVRKGKWVLGYYRESRLNLGQTRLGISVSKKVGKAHTRNRLKRIIREMFRHSPYRDRGVDLLVSVSPRLFTSLKSEELAEVELRRSLGSLFASIFDGKR